MQLGDWHACCADKQSARLLVVSVVDTTLTVASNCGAVLYYSFRKEHLVGNTYVLIKLG
jgi:hypothetical protein